MSNFIPIGEFEIGHIPAWHAAMQIRIQRIITGYENAGMAKQAKEAMDAHVAFIQADADLGKAIKDQRDIAVGNRDAGRRAGATSTADALDHMRLAEASFFENQLQAAAVLDIHRFREELRNEIRTDAATSEAVYKSEAYAFVTHPGFEPSHEATDVPEQYDAISRNPDAFLQDGPEIPQDAEGLKADVVDAPIAEAGDIEPIADTTYDDMQPDSYRPLDTSPFYEAAGRAEGAELASKDFQTRFQTDAALSKAIHDTRKTDPDAANALETIQEAHRGNTDAEAAQRVVNDGVELDGPTFVAMNKAMEQADGALFRLNLLAGNDRAAGLYSDVLSAQAAKEAATVEAAPARRMRVVGEKQPFLVPVEMPATVEATPIDQLDAESPFNDDPEEAEYQQEKRDRDNARKAEAVGRETFDGKLNALIEDTHKTDPEAAEALEIVGKWEDSNRRASDEGRRVSYMELDHGDPDRMRVNSIHDDADRRGEEFDAHPARDRATALLETTFSKEEIAFVAEHTDASKEADAQAPKSVEKTRERRRPLPSEGFDEWMKQESPAAQKPQTPKEITDAFVEKAEQKRESDLAELEKTNPAFVKEYRERQDRMKLDPQELALVRSAENVVAGETEAEAKNPVEKAITEPSKQDIIVKQDLPVPTKIEDAKAELATYDVTINKTPFQDGWKVDFKHGTNGHVPGDEGSAYFASSIEDGVQSARQMRDWRDGQTFEEKAPSARQTAEDAKKEKVRAWSEDQKQKSANPKPHDDAKKTSRTDLTPDEQAMVTAAKKSGDGKSDTDKQPIIVDVAGAKDDGSAKADGKGEKAGSVDKRLALTTPEQALVAAAIRPIVKGDKEGDTQK